MGNLEEGDKILKELTLLRRRIDTMEANRKDLYAKQRSLYIRGDKLGLTAAEMARAMRPDATSTTHLAESIRQVLRKSRGSRRKARTVRKTR